MIIGLIHVLMTALYNHKMAGTGIGTEAYVHKPGIPSLEIYDQPDDVAEEAVSQWLALYIKWKTKLNKCRIQLAIPKPRRSCVRKVIKASCKLPREELFVTCVHVKSF